MSLGDMNMNKTVSMILYGLRLRDLGGKFTSDPFLDPLFSNLSNFG